MLQAIRDSPGNIEFEFDLNELSDEQFSRVSDYVSSCLGERMFMPLPLSLFPPVPSSSSSSFM